MELLLDVIGYGFVFTILGAVLYGFIVFLSKALHAMTSSNDD